MTRQQMKAIVKECLLEILHEGLGQGSMGLGVKSQTRNNVIQTQTQSHVPAKQPVPRRTSPLDMPATSYSAPKNNMSQIIKAESRGNKMMASIFADTAATTLPNMLSHGDSSLLSENSRSAHSLSQQEQFKGTPEQVFGEETSSRWANLAFMDVSSKKSI